jgi:hypothetical protein
MRDRTALRDAAKRAITKTAEDGRATEGTYISWNPQFILDLLDVDEAAETFVNDPHPAVGPSFYALREAVRRARLLKLPESG